MAITCHGIKIWVVNPEDRTNRRNETGMVGVLRLEGDGVKSSTDRRKIPILASGTVKLSYALLRVYSSSIGLRVLGVLPRVQICKNLRSLRET